jgi:hypothetical protein
VPEALELADRAANYAYVRSDTSRSALVRVRGLERRAMVGLLRESGAPPAAGPSLPARTGRARSSGGRTARRARRFASGLGPAAAVSAAAAREPGPPASQPGRSGTRLRRAVAARSVASSSWCGGGAGLRAARDAWRTARRRSPPSRGSTARPVSWRRRRTSIATRSLPAARAGCRSRCVGGRGCRSFAGLGDVGPQLTGDHADAADRELRDALRRSGDTGSCRGLRRAARSRRVGLGRRRVGLRGGRGWAVGVAEARRSETMRSASACSRAPTSA